MQYAQMMAPPEEEDMSGEGPMPEKHLKKKT